MDSIEPTDKVRETCLSLLRGAQAYLKAPKDPVSHAWDGFYAVYDELIRRFVIAQGIPRCDVDDCVQEVWREVAVRLAEFNRPVDRPGLRAWLYALVRSKATNIFRKRARHSAESLDERISAGHEPRDSDADPAAVYERRWERAVLDKFVAQLREDLSPTNRRILQLRLIERRSVDEVSAELNVPAAVIHARQHRILKRLKSGVAGHARCSKADSTSR
jgi:RNA polymerase sigma-70 factor (ECF subfamily)